MLKWLLQKIHFVKAKRVTVILDYKNQPPKEKIFNKMIIQKHATQSIREDRPDALDLRVPCAHPQFLQTTTPLS